MHAKFGRERFLTIHNPLNLPGVGVGHIFFEVRLYIRTCVQHFGAFGRERFLTIDNPLTPWGGGGSNFFFKGETHMRAKFGRGAVRRRGPTVKYIIGRKYARTADARTKSVTLIR